MQAAGLIGPNAILQMLPVIERVAGRRRLEEMLEGAGLVSVPDGSHMIPEADAAGLHRQLRRQEPRHAAAIAAEAGRRTADYILAHRIPRLAQTVLKWLPAPLAARALSRAIARHAWTFVGSGRFRAVTPWSFEIADNPIIRGERSATALCAWHAAVFERLYGVLVASDVTCVETRCGAQGDGPCCFTLRRDRRAARQIGRGRA